MSVTLVIASCLLMVAQDGLGVFLVVFESRGRPLLAGLFDGLGDWPNRLGAAIGGATLSRLGFGPVFVLVSAVSLTSCVTTGLATKAAQRVQASGDDVQVRALAQLVVAHRAEFDRLLEAA